jgi:hypothetical protein
MMEYVKNGGFWTLLKRTEYANNTATKVSPSIQLTQFEDGEIYVHDGHHRCISTCLGGRDYIRDDEYEIYNWTYDEYLEINAPNRWWTPFDPRIHLRLPDVKLFKEEAARRFNVDPQACVKWIRENHARYRLNKRTNQPCFTVCDLATLIQSRFSGVDQ